MDGDNVSCPRCKTTKYRNPSLKLLVNSCGHGLCENCVDLLFVKGSGACPQCGVSLRRSNFRLQLFEDSSVEKEVDIRRKILRDYNKKEEDFPTLREYNDYLEEVEDIIYNLSNGIEVEATKRRVEQYKKDNADAISKNRGRLSRDEELIEELLEQEQEQDIFRKQVILKEAEGISRAKSRQKEALVDQLITSHLPANEILAIHADQQERILREQEKQTELLESQRDRKPGAFGVRGEATSRSASQPTYFSTGIRVGRASNVFVPMSATQDQVYEYKAPEIETNGSNCPTFEDLESDGYLLHVKAPIESEKAGGFVSHYPCYRALQEAFNGLYFKPGTQ
jgi:CDK-activating kinase assembly factor MAT1